MRGLLDLLVEHCVVEQHNDHVIEGIPCAGVEEYADNVAQVVQLVLGEEFIVQVERTEDHVDLRHVIVIPCEERVVEDRQIRPGGIQQTQLMHPAGAVDVREQLLKELQVSLTVEDDHRDMVTILRRTNPPGDILSDDVLEQSRLAGACHSQDNSLHYPDFVRPEPGFGVHVIAEHHGVSGPGVGHGTLILDSGHNKWRSLLPLGVLGELTDDRGDDGRAEDEEIQRGLDELLRTDVQARHDKVQPAASYDEQEE